MPIQKISSIPTQVREAINVASRQTDASFDYLLQTAQRESSFRTNAKSSSSSAAGLFQFVEGTWLKVVKDEGERLGLGEYAKQIKKTSQGQYYVPGKAAREKVLALRHDAEASALVAGAYTEHNARYVSSRIGRSPSEQELYLAHFLGPGSAARMIQLVEQQPDSAANRFFPSAAKANKSIFYEGGNARSVSEVYNVLIASHGGTSSSSREARYGPLDFGMGGLMGDVQASQASYGAGAAGSIGVWGGGTSKSDEAQVKPTAAHPDNSAGHRQAAQHYADHAQTTDRIKGASSGSWMKDAFGGD